MATLSDLSGLHDEGEAVMSRDVDRIIEFVNEITDIPPVYKRVLVNRIDPPPTQEELERARLEVYPNALPWKGRA